MAELIGHNGAPADVRFDPGNDWRLTTAGYDEGENEGERVKRLEVAQLAVAALMPSTLLGLGLIVARNTRRLDSYQHANQTVVARRHAIFQEVAPKLNQLLCFIGVRRGWKEITPAEVLSLKRDVD